MLVLVFVLGLTANAQDTIEKTTGEFSTVKVYDLINLKMIKSDENKVIIAGDNKEDVQVINNNISMPLSDPRSPTSRGAS